MRMHCAKRYIPASSLAWLLCCCFRHTQFIYLSIGYEPKSYSHQLDTLTTRTITMLHYASQQRVNNQRRMKELFKRARLNRAHSSPAAAAPPPTHRPLHDAFNGMSMSDVDSPSTHADELTAPLRKELIDTGRHFSKVATRFAFDNDAASYNAWVIQFKAEAENCGLDGALTDPRTDTALAALRQKTAYHMILSCVPKTILVSITSNLRQHTAYEAWRTLRRHYIGDEATYLQGLETRFNRATWLDGEDFPAFEIRFNQLVAELEAAGQAKSDHVKKSVFLHAVEASSKKDVRGAHVFDRLNTTSQIHFQASFTEWMVYMRVEAQHIHDAIMAHRGVKRPREDSGANAPPSGAVATPVSFVAQPAASASSSHAAQPNRPPPFHAQRNRGDNPSWCRDYRRFGSCRFGAQCKYSHDIPADRMNIAPKSNEPCFKFRQGRCTMGNKCRFAHNDREPAKQEPPASQHLLRQVSPSGAITFDNMQM
jgi:hypothetical protein